MTTSYTARVEWRGELPDDDRLDALVDELASADGALANAVEPDRAVAHVTVHNNTLAAAATDALATVRAAVRSVGLPFVALGLEVLDTDTADARLAEPTVPRLLSASTIAERAGVSKERVRQWAEAPGFPAPVTDPGERYQFWAEPTIERWLATHDRTPGRPPRRTPEQEAFRAEQRAARDAARGVRL